MSMENCPKLLNFGGAKNITNPKSFRGQFGSFPQFPHKTPVHEFKTMTLTEFLFLRLPLLLFLIFIPTTSLGNAYPSLPFRSLRTHPLILPLIFTKFSLISPFSPIFSNFLYFSIFPEFLSIFPFSPNFSLFFYFVHFPRIFSNFSNFYIFSIFPEFSIYFSIFPEFFSIFLFCPFSPNFL